MAQSGLICVGEITSAHGIKGEVKLKSLIEPPESLARYTPLTDEKTGRAFTLKIRSANGAMLIAAVEGVKDRSAAEKLRGVKLFAPRLRRPKPKKGVFYFDDLKGLKAVDEKGKVFGRVTEVMNYGAGDILAVETEEDREYLVPFKTPFAGDPDLEKGAVEITLPPDFPFSEKKKPKPIPAHKLQQKKPKVPKPKAKQDG